MAVATMLVKKTAAATENANSNTKGTNEAKRTKIGHMNNGSGSMFMPYYAHTSRSVQQMHYIIQPDSHHSLAHSSSRRTVNHDGMILSCNNRSKTISDCSVYPPASPLTCTLSQKCPSSLSSSLLCLLSSPRWSTVRRRKRLRLRKTKRRRSIGHTNNNDNSGSRGCFRSSIGESNRLLFRWSMSTLFPSDHNYPTRCYSSFWDRQSGFYEDDKSAYEILGVKPDADMSEIKRAFRKLALQYHPDVNTEPGSRERFMEIREAYKVLSNPNSRAAYNTMQGYGAWRSPKSDGNGKAGSGQSKAKSASSRSGNARRSGYTSYASRKHRPGTSYQQQQQPPQPKPEDEFYGVNDLFRDLSNEWEKEQKKREVESKKEQKKWYEDLLEFLEDSAGLSHDGESSSHNDINKEPKVRSTYAKKNDTKVGANGRAGRSPYFQQQPQQKYQKSSSPSSSSYDFKGRQVNNRAGSNTKSNSSSIYNDIDGKRQKDVDEMLEQLKKEMGID